MIRKAMTAATVLMVLAACSPKPATQAPAASAISATSAAVIDHTLDCTHPVRLKTSAAQVLKDYGDGAIAGELDGPEGSKLKGVAINPDAPNDRLELSWWDDAQTVASMVRAGDHGKAWVGPGGIHVGSTVAEVEAANGKSFSISGFGWDYGGYVTDLKGGKLTGLAGGCVLQLRFDHPDFTGDIPAGISGDGVTVRSGDPRLKAFAAVVTEMSVGWALPEGVKPSADDGGGD